MTFSPRTIAIIIGCLILVGILVFVSFGLSGTRIDGTVPIASDTRTGVLQDGSGRGHASPSTANTPSRTIEMSVHGATRIQMSSGGVWSDRSKIHDFDAASVPPSPATG